MHVHEGRLGDYPCLVAGEGPPLVVLAGLLPQAGVAPGPLRHAHEDSTRLWAQGREVHYVNRRPGMPRGMTMADVAAEHAAALCSAFGAAVDILGLSTGGSIAQQIAAQHPEVVRRLVLVSTGCRLGPAAKSVQRRVAARIRAGALPQACAVFAADLAPPGPLALIAGIAGRLAGPRLLTADGLGDLATMAEAEDGFELAGLPVIQAPTLIVGGGRDRYYGPGLFQETARLIPESRVLIRPWLGHVSVLWSPRSRAEIHNFLGVHSDSGSPQATACAK